MWANKGWIWAWACIDMHNIPLFRMSEGNCALQQGAVTHSRKDSLSLLQLPPPPQQLLKCGRHCIAAASFCQQEPLTKTAAGRLCNGKGPPCRLPVTCKPNCQSAPLFAHNAAVF